PAVEGRAFQLPKILSSLAPVQDDVLVLSGLMDHGGMALGDGPGDHARASASFLTGVHPKKTAGSDVSTGISVDQVAARKVGMATRLASSSWGVKTATSLATAILGIVARTSIAFRGALRPCRIRPR